MVVFDDPATWEASLADALSDLLPTGLAEELRARPPEYVEDAADVLLERGGRRAVITRTTQWVAQRSLASFHGTRLVPEERESIKRDGLRVLTPEARVPRLIRALKHHPDWEGVASRLPEELHRYGTGLRGGKRVGTAYLTLSRAALLSSFNHYLMYGSEFDQNVAVALLGPSGKDALAADGEAHVVTAVLPGQAALDGAHPFVPAARMIEQGDIPNVVREFINAFAFRLVEPDYDPGRLMCDCGFLFTRDIPAEQIVSIEPWVPSQPT